MEYNWADPKKNNKLSSLLMSKAEASRIKRLTSVRSTLSNQLHPSVEGKLRKKKKAGPVSARREAEAADPAGVKGGVEDDDGRHGGDNNSSRLQPDRPRPESDHETCMFEAFDQHAAADGLFHPASAISAFIEHDAKYNSAQPDAKAGSRRKSGRKAATTSKDAPVPAPASDTAAAGARDHGADLGSAPRSHGLPALSGCGSVSSLRLLHTRGSSRSSSASSFASSASVSRESTSSRSDSDLLQLAPRRLDAIPSSADRSALDFYEHDGDESESDAEQGGRRGSGMCEPPAGGDGVDGETADLATKFAALKDMFHQNQASKSGREPGGEPPNGPEEERRAQPSATAVRSSTGPAVGSSIGIGSSKLARGGRGPAGRPAAGNGVKAPCAPAARQARTTKPSVPMRREPKVVSACDAADDAGATDRRPNNQEAKARAGVSLSALKEEHRAALELLKELGGPTDAEFRDEDMDRSIRLLAARSGKQVGAAGVRPVGGRVAAAAKAPTSSQAASKAAAPSLQPPPPQPQPRAQEPEDGGEMEGESPLRPLSSSSSGSMVSRLRSSVALGRVSCGEDAAGGEGGASEREEGGGEGGDQEAADKDSSPREADLRSASDRHSGERDASASSAGEDETEGEADAPERAPAAGAAEHQWQQYAAAFDDFGAAEDESSSADEEHGAAAARGSGTPASSRSATDRYSDEGFEADW